MFLPIDKEDLEKKNIEQVDFVLVTGDAYVDHSSFGTAVIGRVLERYGYTVAILAQPEYKNCEDFKRFGKPRLAFLIGSGNIDSMVNHYSVSKKRRQKDAYTSGGKMGKRPDRAVIIYAQKAKEAYKDVPIIIGGIEASLRRLSHYDYWDNKVRKSILLDSKADLLLYGMSEKSIIEVAEALDSGIDVKYLSFIRGTTFKTKDLSSVYDGIMLPSFEEVSTDKTRYAQSFVIQSNNTDAFTAKPIIEDYGTQGYVVQNPPAMPLTTQELDDIHDLPFMNLPHPIYKEEIAAIKEVQFSISSNRGCFGSCSFCAITFHQGRIVQGRSRSSMVKEATNMTTHQDFKGYIHDVGGPTANFTTGPCDKSNTKGTCNHKKCLFPHPCKNLEINHTEYMKTLRTIRKIKGIKKVFIRSGIRYDYLLKDKNSSEILKEICEHHISGQLRIAPEHISDNTLKYMGKPSKDVYEKFVKTFETQNNKIGKEQYIVPYFMSSHPGSTLDDAIELALYLKKINYIPQQVQDFYPTPSTLSTCIYYTEMDPYSFEPVYVAKTSEEKAMQRALLQYNKKQNYDLVYKALKKAGRTELIEFLIPQKYKGR
ncbi:YgiQ family radical SAM protein [Candidatus Epulonipiscium fishelsonii]|uniref:YgiQ family radical SAM protein n=1 Tax=Candidatus Epulonipiscium fishelsonii TaxID=77094 RepID=A0ACC8XEA0_9FIRM|nr:YgiQ family radical SAM protein [Epulopiscium sp. SCG-B05WGA-EpuloA1]ONI41231.1 YgiQ family radical SAM protein [Epulopiscium sp. SCG-B11WGA-EpuloA1]